MLDAGLILYMYSPVIPHKNSIGTIVTLFPYEESNLPEVMWLAGRARISTQAVLLWKSSS